MGRAGIRGALGVASVALTLAAAGCGGEHRDPATSATARATLSASTSSSTSTTTSADALPGSGRPTVTIGDKNFDEQFVLGQLYLQALRAQGFTVDITQNIGPPAVFTRALASGSLAMYPEYLTTFDETVAGLHGHPHTRAGTLAAGRRWADRHGLRLLPPTPFSDTSAIAVTDAYADAHDLRSIEDLRRVGTTLVLGGASQLDHTEPGLPALSDVYGVSPASFSSLGVGDQYDKLDDGTVQAAYVSSTDGQLASGEYRVLADPRHVFGFGNVVPVVSRSALLKEGPAFTETIERVDRTLTLPVMRALNSLVAIANENPSGVAKAYLQTHGLLTPLPRR